MGVNSASNRGRKIFSSDFYKMIPQLICYLFPISKKVYHVMFGLQNFFDLHSLQIQSVSNPNMMYLIQELKQNVVSLCLFEIKITKIGGQTWPRRSNMALEAKI